MDNDRFFAKGFVSETATPEEIQNSTILTENKKFSKNYPELMRQEGNQLDARNQYRRTLMQTVNIMIAIAVLLGLIYNQK
jgi:uncharacterized membrane protein